MTSSNIAAVPASADSRRPTGWRVWAAFACGAVGIAGALATIYASPSQAPVLSCGVEMTSCDVALTSPVSRLAGVPLGVLGVFYFLFWMLNLREFHYRGRKQHRAALAAALSLGALVSVSLVTYMFAALGAPCLYCLVTHTANLAAVVLIRPWRHWRIPGASMNEIRRLAAITAVSALAASTVHFANETRQAQAEIAHLGTPSLFAAPVATGAGYGYEEFPEDLAGGSAIAQHTVQLLQ